MLNMVITEEELEQLVDKQWVDVQGSIDNILGLIGKTNINRNKKLDGTNLKLDELINLSGGTPPTKDILPGDKGVSLARGNSGDIISCVINGITTNAIAKTDIAKHESIIVVPGGNYDEPYVVSGAVLIKGDYNGLPVNVAVDADGVLSVNDINNAEVATTPTIYNVTMINLDIEYSQALPVNTKIIEFRCQENDSDVRYSFETGKVATPTVPYRTLFTGEVKTLERLNLTSKTLYIACSTAGKTVEIECWT